MDKITKQADDFSQWYLDVVKVADLADYSKTKGCMVIKPYGYAIWELLQADLDRRIKEMGVKNLYFPLLIPESFLKKEKDHVEGFSPEVAVVTHAGGKKLSEPYVIRPTSETIMYDTFADWVQGYKDLPLLTNQWANIVRWEMRTRPFLRTTEFLWQEGHTVHASKEEADEFAQRALDMYEAVARETLSFAVLKGPKSENEKFAGALYTTCVEALARDGKAIQAGTSHNLGQNFAKAFGITYLDEKNTEQHAWQTSWGVSTRLIGTMIVVHGDDKGLRLPPAVAPVQAIIVPIYKSDDEKKKVLQKSAEVEKMLKEGGIRVEVDDREGVNPGFKYNEWEAKGVPLRLEIGPKDLEKDAAMVARRDNGQKESIGCQDLPKKVAELLGDISQSMLKESEDNIKNNTHEAKNYDEFKKTLEAKGGFIRVPWAGSNEEEKTIQTETKATIRILEEGSGKCFYTGKKATQMAYFAKAY